MAERHPLGLAADLRANRRRALLHVAVGLIQLRHFGHTFGGIAGSFRTEHGGGSSCAVPCTSPAPRVGTGNIARVAGDPVRWTRGRILDVGSPPRSGWPGPLPRPRWFSSSRPNERGTFRGGPVARIGWAGSVSRGTPTSGEFSSSAPLPSCGMPVKAMPAGPKRPISLSASCRSWLRWRWPMREVGSPERCSVAVRSTSPAAGDLERFNADRG